MFNKFIQKVINKVLGVLCIQRQEVQQPKRSEINPKSSNSTLAQNFHL